jgi:hypothetical protein
MPIFPASSMLRVSAGFPGHFGEFSVCGGDVKETRSACLLQFSTMATIKARRQANGAIRYTAIVRKRAGNSSPRTSASSCRRQRRTLRTILAGRFWSLRKLRPSAVDQVGEIGRTDEPRRLLSAEPKNPTRQHLQDPPLHAPTGGAFAWRQASPAAARRRTPRGPQSLSAVDLQSYQSYACPRPRDSAYALIQSSRRRPAMCENSPVLCVTRITSSACA